MLSPNKKSAEAPTTQISPGSANDIVAPSVSSPIYRHLITKTFCHCFPVRRFHAHIEVHRDADRLNPQAGRRRSACERPLPASGHQRRHVLPVEEHIRWPRGVLIAPGEGLGSGECQAKTDVRRVGVEQHCIEGSDCKKTLGPVQKRESVRFLTEEHARPLSRSCGSLVLSRAALYSPPLDWTVLDADIIAALAKLVEEHPSRGFWKCSDQLRKKRKDWNPKRIYRVYKAMKLNLRRAAKRRLPNASVWRFMYRSFRIPCAPSTS